MTSFLPSPKPLLPREESFWHHRERKFKLWWERRWYKYNFTHVSPLAVAKSVPITSQFSFKWLKVVGGRVLSMLENRAELELNEQHKAQMETRHKKLREMLDLGEASVKYLFSEVLDVLKFDGRFGAPATPAKALQDYQDLFRTIGLPPIVKDFADDRVYASMRVAGPNPVMLQRMTRLDERLPITDELFQVAAPGDSLHAALAEGRLYLADYAILDGAELSTFPNGQKYLYAPLALFVVAKGTLELLPVAIQCQQKPAPDNPIFTPDDGDNWLIAKTIVETADGNVHEASTHLGRTHLTMEAFVLATYRQLAENHPLSILLRPHFQGTLAINEAAWQHLIADKGAVDKLFGGTIQTSRAVAVQSVQSTRVMSDLLPLTFARRGVDDPGTLPSYPYRDDSLLYWEAIHEWVSEYVRLYYPDDAEIARDPELKEWMRELASNDGGRIGGLPNGGDVRTVAELIEVISFIIFTCSVQHAAVNFPQYDCMSYVPNMPLAGYRPAPTAKKGATHEDWLAMLPTLDMAELQMELGYLLGSVHYTELGRYERGHFRDPRVSAPLVQFQQRLENIGRTIEERNQTRRPYSTLAPSGIPQSINI